MIKITAAELLKYAFDESGLRTVFVASKYGIELSTLNTWKRGAYCPKYDDLCGVLELMGFDLVELITTLREVKELETMRL